LHDLPADLVTGASQPRHLSRLTPQIQTVLGPDVQVLAWREGADFWADLALRGSSVLGVLRSPKKERLLTSYDGVVDYAEIMAKEAEVLGILRAHHLPVPGVLAWRRRIAEGELSWMLCEYIPHTPVTSLSTAQQESLGHTVKQIHAISPTSPLIQRRVSWSTFMLERLGARLLGANRYCPQLPVAKIAARAEQVFLARETQATSLLHMDLRASNLCIAGDKIAAVMDVANAMIGDPWLELGRLRSYGLLTEDFRRGYGLSDEDLFSASPALDLYELETAAMLMCVAREESHDPELFEISKARALELIEAILA